MQDEQSREDLRGGSRDEGGPFKPSFGLSGAGDQEQEAEAGAEPADPEFAPPDYVELSTEEAAREMVVCRDTLRRIERMICVAGAASAAAVLWPLGRAVAAGVVLGTVLAWINFRWLAASVNAIGERIVKARSRERGAYIVARGVGRIGLIALFAYGIFECSVRGLMGFLAGLAMPVIAMMCEAAYEFVVSIRRPS